MIDLTGVVVAVGPDQFEPGKAHNTRPFPSAGGGGHDDVGIDEGMRARRGEVTL